jgi:alpha(1,3/1,4) fucosyltransferase
MKTFIFFATYLSLASAKSVNLISTFCPERWLDGRREVYSRHTVTCSSPEHIDFQKLNLNFSEYDKFIFFDLNVNQQLPKEITAKTVLFHVEPVKYNYSYFDNFGRVYTWDDRLVDNRKFFKFYYAHLKPMMDHIPNFNDKKLCCMVTSHWKQHRLDCLEYFSDKPGFLDVYGKQAPYIYMINPMYKGPIAGDLFGDQKHEVMSQYKFCMCFENEVDELGYVTEKIFSCFASGCVPIYWGARNISDYIPENCYVDFRQFKSYDEVALFMMNIDQEVYNQYLENIRDFLMSEQAKVFSSEQYEKTLLEAIES